MNDKSTLTILHDDSKMEIFLCVPKCTHNRMDKTYSYGHVLDLGWRFYREMLDFKTAEEEHYCLCPDCSAAENKEENK